MRYQGRLYRPPSEHDAFILQATLGCSWNHCTYCDMYRDKTYGVRALDNCLHDVVVAHQTLGPGVRKLFVADGDALGMPMDHWRSILQLTRDLFPALKRVSCYAMARNVLDKTPAELAELHELGLSLLYIGPESGDDLTLKRIAKGGTFGDHVGAAERAREAGLRLSVIGLLGAGGVERSEEHARATGELITQMDPSFFSALTLTVIPGTPQAKLQERGRWQLPDVPGLFRELRTMVAVAAPTDAVFRTNHASNYLPLAGRLPADRDRILATLDAALCGQIPLRPEWARGL